jgi:hypothetical protein
MKLTRYNYIEIYVDCVVNFRGRDVKIKWTTEDGYIDGNFDSVFFDLDSDEYDQVYDEFVDNLPIFDLGAEGFENESYS